MSNDAISPSQFMPQSPLGGAAQSPLRGAGVAPSPLAGVNVPSTTSNIGSNIGEEVVNATRVLQEELDAT